MRDPIVTYNQALMLKRMGFTESVNTWYRPFDRKLFKDQTGFSCNSNGHRLSAPRVSQVIPWLLSLQR